jgi:hypothetical protein
VLAQDQIRFFNRKTQKEESLRGNITEENPSTVKFKESGKTLVEIPAPDILEIDYQPPKGMSSFDYRSRSTRNAEPWKRGEPSGNSSCSKPWRLTRNWEPRWGVPVSRHGTSSIASF